MGVLPPIPQWGIFEFEKIFFNFIDIFMYIVSFFTISVVAQIVTGTISIISIVIQILRPTILRQGFQKDLLGWEVHF